MLTIGIKTFCRPNTISQCLDYIFNFNTTYYPIIIADDSYGKYKQQNSRLVNRYRYKYSADITLLNLPFDTGLSYGRNQIVLNCQTKYLMIIDDSRTFTHKLNIPKMITFLENNPKYHLFAGIIPGRIGNHKKYSCLFGKINKNGNTVNITGKPNKKINNKLFNNLEETNIVVNTFIARTDSLRNVKWRDKLKMGEHEQFFLDWYHKGYKCVIPDARVFNQVRDRKYPNKIMNFRLRAVILRPVNIAFPKIEGRVEHFQNYVKRIDRSQVISIITILLVIGGIVYYLTS